MKILQILSTFIIAERGNSTLTNQQSTQSIGGKNVYKETLSTFILIENKKFDSTNQQFTQSMEGM